MKKVALDFSCDEYAMLQRVKGFATTDSNAEAIRNALRLYEWYLSIRESGCVLQVIERSSAGYYDDCILSEDISRAW